MVVASLISSFSLPPLIRDSEKATNQVGDARDGGGTVVSAGDLDLDRERKATSAVGGDWSRVGEMRGNREGEEV
ncbi:unnamed protein product [Linum trigynum]|uniref:Uncharacterized protein n=1 Tax=Linum trigynum TaxID=586398 RepID=A0AAV2CCI1_9ROSI